MAEKRAQLDRLTVLLVEPSAFLSSLIRSVLRAFGIVTVVDAESGSEAVALLESIALDPLKVGVAGIDLVISEVLLPDIDGLAVLRWIRTSDNSPDRFLPFLVLTAAAEKEEVARARDAGASEFMVKPFSARSIAGHLMYTISHPRQFVLSGTYFGPDRRRHPRRVSEERRVTRADEIETILTASKINNVQFNKRVIYFRLLNRLKDKIGVFALKDVPILDPDLIAAAEQQIQAMAGDYADWMRGSISKLETAVTRLENPSTSASAVLVEINRIAHEFRGQGGIFGYPLMTEFGKSLFEATQDRTIAITPAVVKLIDAHVDSLKVVMQQRIKGDGGPVGRELLESLAQAKRKYRGRRPGQH